MRAFLDRWLPIEERATVLWLAIGGAAIVFADGTLSSFLLERIGSASPQMPDAVQSAVSAAMVFAATVALVAVAIRVLGAPKSLALFVVVTVAAKAAGILLGLPAGWLQRTAFAISHDVSTPLLQELASQLSGPIAVAVGAWGGALVAGFVTLDRIRDTGSDEDDEASAPAKAAPLGKTLLASIGWEPDTCPDEGRRVAGLCVFRAATTVGSALIGAIVTVALGFARNSSSVGDLLPRLVMPLSTVSGAAIVFAAAAAVFRRHGLRSTWLVLAASGVFGLLTIVLSFVASRSGAPSTAPGETMQWVFASLLPWLLSTAAVVGSAFAGVMYAESRTVATLDSSDAHDASEPTESPDDTTGGTDG
jgi:hypothetical protein